MRHIPVFLSLALVAACATPRESCISDANRELRVINKLVQQTRGNLSRGYAVTEEQEVRVRRSTCEGVAEDGTTFRFPCEKTQTHTRRVPVAIDLDAERTKLASLEQRQLQMQSNVQSAVQQCVAIHPE